MPVTHIKINNIPDWTQADLNAQIALGNFPAGKVLNDITLPSDWNAAHNISINYSELNFTDWAGTFDGQEGVYYLNRTNHTGTQLAATISDFSEATDDRVSALIQNGTGISWTYNDAGNTLTGNVSLSSFSTSNLSEGSNLYFTDERAQDAIGAMVDSTLIYVDATPLLTRAAINGDISIPQASNTATLPTVNSNVGSFGSASQVGVLTVNAKGLATAASNVAIQISESQVTNLTTDLGNKQPLDSTLTSLAAYNTNGIITQTAPDTFVGRTISAGSSKISIANGDGVVGNPAVDVTEANLTHNNLGGLTTGDPHTQYALLAGRSGGQTLIGGTSSGDNLTLKSSSNATRGKIIFGNAGTTAYDDVNNRIGIGTASPSFPLHIVAPNNQEGFGLRSGASNAYVGFSIGRNQLTDRDGIFAVAGVAGNFVSDSQPGDIILGSEGTSFFITSNFNSGSLRNGIQVTSAGNIKIAGSVTAAASRGTTEGTSHLDIFNGTAPVGTLTNGISLYSTAGELRVMDAAGNATLLSPHDKETNEWIYDSKDTTTGKRLKIDIEKMLRFLNEHFGTDFIHEYMEAVDG